VNVEDMPAAGGWAITLTMGGRPDTADQWHYVLKLLCEHMTRKGAELIHWVIEWTAEGRPHLHMAVYAKPGLDFDLVVYPKWLELCRRMGWPASQRGQHLVRINGVQGWLEYVSKHTSRGVAHYQRQGAPEGWTRTGRLWGHRGAWPVWTPEVWDLEPAAFYRYRRLLIAYQRDRLVRVLGAPKARAKMVGNSIRDKERGRFAGVGYWVPAEVSIKLRDSAIQWGGSHGADGKEVSNGTHYACDHQRASCGILYPRGRR
jgi:hypothetical protein